MANPASRYRFGIGASNQGALLIVATVSIALAAAAVFVQYKTESMPADMTKAMDETPHVPLPAGPRKFN